LPTARVFGLIGGLTLSCHGIAARTAEIPWKIKEIPWKINESIAQQLAAEGHYGADKGLEYFDYDSGVSNNFTPPFIVFDGRRRFTRDELKQYARLRRLEPECTVED
jgi:hypothetical protein